MTKSIIKKSSLLPINEMFLDNFRFWEDYFNFSFFNENIDFNKRRAISFFDVNEDNYELKFELPGVEMSEINIERTDYTLTVYAEQKSEKNRYFSFKKITSIPEDSDLEKIEGNLKNGILTITIPKLKSNNKKDESVKVPITA